MKLIDSLLKTRSKKIFLELSNLSNDLDNLSIKSSLIFSRIDNITKNIQDFDEKLETSKNKINLAIKKNNLPLAKKAFKKWILLKDTAEFYKNYSEKSQKEKNKISKDLLELQECLDLSFELNINNENSKAKETISKFKELEKKLYLYLEKVQSGIPKNLVEFTEPSVDINIAFYDYLEEFNLD